MNDQNVNTAALSEIDRLGQKVLDAIWAEEAAYNGNKEAVTKVLAQSDQMDPEESMRRVGELLGTEGAAETVRKSIDIWRLGSEREAAVKEYLMARRLLHTVL